MRMRTGRRRRYRISNRVLCLLGWVIINGSLCLTCRRVEELWECIICSSYVVSFPCAELRTRHTILSPFHQQYAAFQWLRRLDSR